MINIKEKIEEPYKLKTTHKSIICGLTPVEYDEYNIIHDNRVIFKTLNDRIALNAKSLFNAAFFLGSQSIPHFLLHTENKQKKPYTLKTLKNSDDKPVFLILECFNHSVCEFHAKDLHSIQRLVTSLNTAYVDSFRIANLHENTPYIEHNEFYI